MRDIEPTSEDPLVVDARLRQQENYTPVWAGLLSPVQTFVALLPSYKDTRAGREASRQIKIFVFVVAAAAMIFGGSLPWIIIGALAMLLSLAIPLPEGVKRSLQSRLKALRSDHTRQIETAGRLVVDGRRLVLQEDDTNLRRVLIDRNEHRVVAGDFRGAAALKVSPKSARKADSIWVVCEAMDPSELGRRREEWTDEDVDQPVFIGPEAFRNIRDSVGG